MSTLLAAIIVLVVVIIGALVVYMAAGPGGHPWGPPNGNNDPELAALLAAAQTQTASLITLLGFVDADLQIPFGRYITNASALQAGAASLGLHTPSISQLATDLSTASQGVQTYLAKFSSGAGQLAGFTVSSDVGAILGAVANMPFAMQQNLPPVQDGFSLVATDLNLLWNEIYAQVQLRRSVPSWLLQSLVAVQADEADAKETFAVISTAAALAWSAVQALLSNLSNLGAWRRRRLRLTPASAASAASLTVPGTGAD